MREVPLEKNPNITAAELLALHEGAWRWAFSILRDRSRTDDVMQTVYEQILCGAARFSGRSSLKTWLYGVVRNTAHASLRRKNRRLQLVSVLAADAAAGAAVDHAGGSGREGRYKRLGEILRALPQRQREVLELSIYRDFSLQECAAVMGIGLGAVRTHYHRGKQKLRELLGADDGTG